MLIFFNDLSLLLKLPVLSDGGTALKSFVGNCQLIHFLCIHHLVKNIGTKSFLGKLAAKVLISHTEEMFLKNFQDYLEIANSYKENSTTGINKKFLDSYFMKESLNENGNMEIVPDLDNKKEEIAKTVLFHRGPIAAATNHTEGFHTHLKIISKERKGLGYNLLKLI